MRIRSNNQHGFIPMIIMLILLIGGAIVFAYLRVKSHQEG